MSDKKFVNENEKANLLKITNLPISRIDNAVKITRNGVEYVEMPGFDFRLDTPKIARGERVVKNLSKVRKLEAGFDKGLEKAKGYAEKRITELKPTGKITRQVINKDKKALLQYPEMPHYVVSETEVKVPAGWLIEQAGFKG